MNNAVDYSTSSAALREYVGRLRAQLNDIQQVVKTHGKEPHTQVRNYWTFVGIFADVLLTATATRQIGG